MAPPRPRSKRSFDDDGVPSPASRKKVAFKGEPMFLDDDYSEDEANGIQVLKRIKVSPGMKNGSSHMDEEAGFGPHIIKMGQYDEGMLNRVVSKYKKMGHSVQLKNNIIKLNVIKSSTCLQEEVMGVFNGNLEHTDMTLVSSTGEEIPCHRFILAVRSPVFKRLFSSQQNTGEPLREVIDASTEALKAMVKYLYTDSLENQDINEDLMTLADKYGLTQMKELCLPHFVKKIHADNCLKAYIYGHLHNYEPLKSAAFHTLDQNWKRYETSNDVLEMMKSHPNAVLEILNRLHKKKSGYLVQSPQINLKMIKAFQCLQEEIIKAFNEKLDHTDMALISNSGEEFPCHKFILAVRSHDFRSIFANAMEQEPPAEPPVEGEPARPPTRPGPFKLQTDASSGAIAALVKYLYTDSVENDDITEDLIALSDKHNLIQLREYCMPTFIENISSQNCLKLYVYAYKHNFEELKTAAFKTLDEHWKHYAKSPEFLDLMKNCPDAVMGIMSRLHKVGTTNCQPIVLDNVKPRLVDF